MTIILGPANAQTQRKRCTRCRKQFDWRGWGDRWCPACEKKETIRTHANDAPDYVEMAIVAIEAFTGRPRKTWAAQGEEHRAVTVLLKRWAELRAAA